MSARPPLPFWVLPLNVALTVSVILLALTVWSTRSPLPPEQMLALRLVHEQVSDKHVDPPAAEDLMWSAVEGMVGSLDEHSGFVRPEEVSAFEEDTNGVYEGIGIVMATALPPVTVRFPIPGGPAERAGMQVGDHILSVDGKPIRPADGSNAFDHAKQLLLGPPGTTVDLVVARGESEIEVQVERDTVQKPSVKWAHVIDADLGIGYVFVQRFQPGTTDELLAAVATLRRKAGGELKGLILDLRNNRGGLLEESVNLSNVFLREGVIVSLKRRKPEDDEKHIANPEKCTLPDLPLVVLVNNRSASASEVFAGALQDHGRAALVGERTFGKGVVQSVYRWEGLDFRLKLTTAHYYTPSGRCIERTNRRAEDGDAVGGIPPDIEVPLEREEGLRVRRNLIERWEVPERYRDAVRTLTPRGEAPVPKAPGPDDDAQLAKALEEVRRRIEE